MTSKRNNVQKEKCDGARRTADKGDWGTHEQMMREAMRKSAIVFMAEHADRIKKVSNEEVAYRSYVCGVIDALTVARNAIGFWGADEIRKEFERWNSMRMPKVAEPAQSSDEQASEEINDADSPVNIKNVQAEVADFVASRKKENADKCQDVMFA